ncbi:hypothetical protein FRC06_005094 [Ceratobasidium sp. 370]|nr:hypothetical protein FRC06_005094 [Ceratobasidium sp. 370]
MTTHSTHNPLTGDGVNNTHNSVTGQANDGDFGRNERQYGPGGQAGPQDTQSHNTHNPLTGDGVINIHSPPTGDKTGPDPRGANPVTGRTDDGNFGRNEQEYHQEGPAGLEGTPSHNTHDPLAGSSPNNTHNPLTGDKAGPNPPAGTNLVTGRMKDGELGRGGGTGDGTGPKPPQGANPVSGQVNDGEFGRNEQQYSSGDGTGPQGAQSRNTHNPLTGGDPNNTHNPLTGDKTGPSLPPRMNPVTGRTNDDRLGKNEQQHARDGGTGPQGIQSHNTHNPLTGGGPDNTHNPMTGDTTGPVTGRARDGELGRDEKQYGQGGQTGPQSAQTHDTHNPLTGGGLTNTHNPMTGHKTDPNSPPGTNPVTGKMRDGELGRSEQHYGPGGGTGPQGTQTHNTHNPLTGSGPNNPLTSDTTGPNPPPGTNTVMGGTRSGELGRNEQQHLGGAGVGTIGTAGTGHTGQNTGHTGNDTTRGAHIATGAGVGTTNTTSSHQTSPSTSGAIQTLVGKAEAAVGKFLDDPKLQAKGVQRQQRAVEAKIDHTGAVHRAMHPDPAGSPTQGYETGRDKSAAGGGHVGAGAGQTGGQATI